MKISIVVIIIATVFSLVVFKQAYRGYSGTTIHLAGDSTMSVKRESNRPDTGWGEPFESMLCDQVRLVNHAKNGRSTKSFLSEGLWDALLEQLQTGDVVMIQFGHNDQKISRADLYTNPWQDYTENLQRFVSDVRALGAEPVLLTSIVRREFNSQGRLIQTLGDYPAATRATATRMKVTLIDLNTTTHEFMEAMGAIASKQYYLHLPPDTHANYSEGKKDNTHLNSTGAHEVAIMAAAKLDQKFPNLVCL